MQSRIIMITIYITFVIKMKNKYYHTVDTVPHKLSQEFVKAWFNSTPFNTRKQ